VAKFAGDALLCTFQGADEEECLIRAQNCAVDMLMGMRRYNNSATSGQLQIHGGIAKGSILHFHLGSSDDELRWYLVAGDAVASAISLVERANPGQILLAPKVGLYSVKVAGPASPVFRAEGRGFGSIVQTKKVKDETFLPVPEEGVPIGIMGLIEENKSTLVEMPMPTPVESPKRISKRIVKDVSFKSRGISESEHSETSHISYGTRADVVSEDGEKIELFMLTADTSKVELGQISSVAESRSNAQSKAIYDIQLHISGTAYIPKALRAKLRTGFNASEMRNRVAVVFVGLQSLALSNDELATHIVSGEKLDALNTAFVSMTRVSHSFDGEVRDLLFDDKGCIFIAVFGAHGASELSELKATKCAMAITQEFPTAKVGVSVGTCFVGMCGSAKRHDFVVMGQEVNVAARCMIVAQEGEVLVSQEIEKETRDLISYEKIPVKLSKKESEVVEETFAYRASSEIARRPSFLALYRYGLRDRDLFVGRADELALVEHTVMSVCFGDAVEGPTSSNGQIDLDAKRRMQENKAGSGVIMLEAPAGMGKSAFVSRVKKLGKGRVKIASTAAFSLEQENEYFVFRHLIESYTGFRRDMTKEQLKLACDDWGGPEGQELNLDIIAEVLPWIKDLLNGHATGGVGTKTTLSSHQRAQASSMTDMSSSALVEKIGREIMKVFSGFRGELTLNQILAGEGNNGALLIIEDIQWMDLQSLQLLRYLLENLPSMDGVVFFLTMRTDRRMVRAQSMNDMMEIRGAEQLRDTLVDHIIELGKYGPKSVLTIPLHGLAKNDCSKLVARLLEAKDEEHGVAHGVVNFVYEKTDGFPMYVVLLIEWIREHQLITINDKKVLDWTNPSVPETASFPNTLADTMIARFDRLDVQTRDLLKIASAMGNEFDAITLTTLAKIDLGKNNNTLTEEKVLESLKHAQELNVLVVKKVKGIKESAHKWRFKNDTMLQAIQSIIPSERANQLKALLKPMRQEVEKKKLVPLFAGFLGEVGDDD